jgi:hypothetical protein
MGRVDVSHGIVARLERPRNEAGLFSGLVSEVQEYVAGEIAPLLQAGSAPRLDGSGVCRPQRRIA